jgi:3-hydroxyisobutyrate dehydrogenase-like beta-hydroxyacid dehydrogenase
MTSHHMQIAFLGIGLMGFRMARNLLQAGFDVTIWNRTAGKAAPLAEFGGRLAKTAHKAVYDADIVITMLSDGPAVSALLFDEGVAAELNSGSVFVDMSSIKPEEAQDHAARLAKHKVLALDAPVSGGTTGADAATLAIMAGGEATAFAIAEPVLCAMGRPVHVGPSGCGQIAKLANQGIVAITIGAVAEAILLAERAGLAKGALRQALSGGFADSVIFQQHGRRMEEGDFVPGGRSTFQLKDLNNLLNSAQSYDLALPLASALRDRFQTLVQDLDGGDLDHSALYLELLERNKS